MQGESWQYYAFISYRHTDLRTARWLQRKLEAYRLPTVLQRQLAAPARVRPVFRDGTDLASGPLRASLKGELARSRYLIVLCSRALQQKPDYVNFEVESFCRMGREKQIIPLILDGEPNAADPAQECYPASLRALADVPLGIDLRREPRRRALIRVVATLLDVRFDTLWKRDLRRQRAHRLLAAIAAAAVLAAGYAAWDYYVPKTARFADYALCYGVPEGIGPLTDTQARESAGYYSIVTSQGLVRELRHENAQGVLVPNTDLFRADRPVRTVYETYSGRELRTARTYDQYGAPLVTLKYSERFGEGNTTQTLDYYQGYNDSIAQNMPSNLSGMGNNLYTALQIGYQRSRIIRAILTYTPQGWVAQELYAADTRSLQHYAADASGNYGRAYVYNALGQPTEVYFLNALGARAALPDGVYCQRLEYGGVLPTRCAYTDAQGNCIRNGDGTAQITLTYDAAFNPTGHCFLSPENSPEIGPLGYARQTAEYRDGNCVRMAVFDAQGNPCNAQNGFAALRREYRDGRLVCDTLLDAGGNPCVCNDGYAQLRITYDAQGRPARNDLLDAQGAPCYGKDGYASLVTLYDSLGHAVRNTFLDTEGKPCTNASGACVAVCTYDGANLTLLRYLDADGNPTLNPQTGYAAAQYTYEDDNLTGLRFLDTQGQPCAGLNGFAEARYAYADGNMVSAAFFGAGGLPCYAARTDGSVTDALATVNILPATFAKVCAVQATYTDGRLVSRKYTDITGTPRLYGEPYAEERFAFDALGRCVERSTWDAQGNLVCGSDGYAVTRYAYDALGNTARIEYRNAAGQPTNNLEGKQSILKTYDAQGRLLSVAYYDKDGQARPGNGYSSMRYAYDARGRQVQRSVFLTAAGKEVPSLYQGCWAVETSTYDAWGRLTSVAYTGLRGEACADENQVHSYRYAYDAQGRVVRQETLGLDGQPLADGSALTTEYNAMGQVVAERAYRDGDVLSGKKTYRYNARGALTALAFWSDETTPATGEDGYHRAAYAYDAYGNRVSEQYYDAAGLPVLCKDGFAAIFVQYDAYGRQASVAFEDASGAPCRSADGYAFADFTYDAAGNQTRMRVYDPQHRPDSPVAEHGQSFDAQGQLLENWVLGPDGQPPATADVAVARIRYTWKNGDVETRSYWDGQGNPVENAEGVARYVWDIDDQGVFHSTRTYAADGTLLAQWGADTSTMQITQFTKLPTGKAAALRVGDVLLRLGDWRFGDLPAHEEDLDALGRCVDAVYGTPVEAVFLQTAADGTETTLRLLFTFNRMGLVLSDVADTPAHYAHCVAAAQALTPAP